MKKWIKNIIKLMGVLLGLLIFLLLLLRIPVVQTAVLAKVNKALSKKISSTIHIEKVNINFIDHLSIQGIYLEDQNMDTLFYAESLEADLAFFRLLKKEINLEEILLKSSVIRVHQMADSSYNFDFLLEAFASEDTSSKAFPFEINVGTVSIDHADYQYNTLGGSNQLRFQQLLVKMKALDLNALDFNISSIVLEGLQIYANSHETVAQAAPKEEAESMKTITFPFDNLPISLTCEELLIHNSLVFYKKGGVANGPNFNVNNTQVTELELHMQNIILNDSLLALDWKQMDLCLNHNRALRDFNLYLKFDKQNLAIKSEPWSFNQSNFDFNFNSSYASFNNLAQLDSSLQASFETKNSLLAFNDLHYFLPELDSIEALHNLRNEQLSIQANIAGKMNELSLDQFEVKVLNSMVNLAGGIKNIKEVNELELENITLNLQADLADLRLILGEDIVPKKYESFGSLGIDAILDGGLKKLKLQKFALNTEADLQANLSGVLGNLNDLESLSYDLNVAQLKTSYQDALHVTDAIPSLLQSLAVLTYQGKVKGDLNTFDIDGNFNSALGSLQADLFIDFNATYSDANYKGNLALQNFQLGSLLDNDSLGLISLEADFDGKGLNLESLEAVLGLDISAFSFNSYLYQDILVDGRIDSRKFEGILSVKDENLQFDFQGLVNLNDSLPEYNFQANLDRINTEALHLTPFPLVASLKINSALSGKTIDDIEGNVKITEVQLSNEEQNWKADSIVFQALNGLSKGREIRMSSEFLNAEIEGNFKLANLPKMFLALGDEHFPFTKMIGNQQSADVYSDSTLRSMKDENIKLQASLKNLPEIASFFTVDLKRLDSANLFLNLDGPNHLIDFEFFIPSIDYQNIHVDSFYMAADTKSGSLQAKFTVDSASYGEFAYLPGFAMHADFKDKLAYVRTYIQNDTGSYSLDMNAELYNENAAVGIRLMDPFMLNTRLWEITQTGSLLIGDTGIVLPQFSIKNGKQVLSFASTSNEYNLSFKDFDLNNLLELVEIDSFLAKGSLNGYLRVNNESNAAAVESDLSLKKFTINNAVIGDVKIDASLLGNMVNAALDLQGVDNVMNANLSYDIDQKDVEGQVRIEKLYLPSYEAFLKQYISDLEGSLYGKLNISGKTDDPKFNGRINFNGAKAYVKAAGTKYGIALGYLDVSERELVPKLSFIDEAGKTANLSGLITHTMFQNLKFKLSLDTDGFTFLNSKKDADALFYGKFIASTTLSIEGDLAMPKVRGKLNTLPESDITVQLLSEKAIATQENYVVFLNGADYSKEEIDSIANERYEINTLMDISLLIDVNEKTMLNIIIDPLTGDRLMVQGNGQLSLKIPPKGDIDINGIYTITKGQYNFSFQKLLKRKFEIVAGSQIVFSGDPLNARMDVKAAYNTEASTYPLVEGQSSSLSQEEEREIKKKQEVSVSLNIEGKLAEPQLSFDIDLLNSGESPIGSNAKRSLDILKQNESELNKQVFSLLLFNSFSGSTSSGNISSTGSSTAVRSVGNLINTQLNRLASKAEGLQINFDLDQYQDQLSESNEQITEIDLGISQSLLNDKLVISVGGNVDLESGNQNQSSLGNLAGDFVIEYKLSEDGKYKVRVFQKSDYDALNDANLWKTGAGFSYQTRFGKLKKKNGGKP